MKIIIGINTLTQVSQPIYSNHCQFWYRLGKERPQDTFMLNNPLRMSIDNMRNMTAKVALENDCDYIFFIDDDILVPFDALDKLLACEAEIAAGWTCIRGYPYKNMFFRYTDVAKTNLVPFEDIEVGVKEPFDVDAVGFSCCLIKVDLLRKMQPPYFVTGPYNTEDIYFCIEAKKQFPDIKIVVDPKVITSHLVRQLFVDPINKTALKVYEEMMNPDLCKMAVEPEKNPIRKHTEDMNLSYEQLLKEASGL